MSFSCGRVMPILAGLAIFLGGCGAPSSFSKQPSGWKSIELRPDLQSDYTEAWEVAVDTIARNYDLEIIDKDSGYMRTSWKFGIASGSYDSYRGRIIIKFPTTIRPNQVDVKTDASWFDGKRWLTGFDSAFDREVFGDLSGRLSRTAPTY